MTILYWQQLHSNYEQSGFGVLYSPSILRVCSIHNFANGIDEEQVIISHTDLLSSNSDLLWGHRNMENLHICGNALQALQVFAALV